MAGVKELGVLRIENARLVFRNFSGNPDKYNAGGRRTAAVVIESLEVANTLRSDGWNVKDFKPNPDTGDVENAYLPFKISYDNKPPKIVLITGRNHTYLDAQSVSMLDWADIINVDLVVSPYRYDVQGKQGVSAYLKTMYVTVQEDEFADKYSFEDEPDYAEE